jgi:hypothetical protein
MPIELEKEKNMNEMERKPYSSESMRVRCPHCRKLYLVQFGDIKETRPRFECVECHERFWLSLPDMDMTQELTGFPVQMKEPPVSKPRRTELAPSSPVKNTEPCPKCFKIVTSGTSECPHCGILINKMKELAFAEETVPHSPALATAWKKVVADYGNESMHADFLRLAQRERNLLFSATQYGQMLKLMPSDQITRQRLSEVQALASVMMPKSTRQVKGAPSRLWQIPLLASALMMIVGFFIPMFRNMVGVGAAFFFLALAFQIQFRRREH